jgi:hypothetical protein
VFFSKAHDKGRTTEICMVKALCRALFISTHEKDIDTDAQQRISKSIKKFIVRQN